MAKRSSSSQSAITRALTGGTGDVNPNIFRFPPLVSTALNAVDRFVAPTPLQAFNNTAQNRATVMEILKVYFSAKQVFNTSVVGQSLTFLHMTVQSTRNADVNAVEQGMAFGGCLASKTLKQNVQATGSTLTEPIIEDAEWEVDMTDGAGHGVLLAGPEVEFATVIEMFGSATVSESVRTCAFLYRFKDVPLTEYLGILSSAQVGA